MCLGVTDSRNFDSAVDAELSTGDINYEGRQCNAAVADYDPCRKDEQRHQSNEAFGRSQKRNQTNLQHVTAEDQEKLVQLDEWTPEVQLY